MALREGWATSCVAEPEVSKEMGICLLLSISMQYEMYLNLVKATVIQFAHFRAYIQLNSSGLG